MKYLIIPLILLCSCTEPTISNDEPKEEEIQEDILEDSEMYGEYGPISNVEGETIDPNQLEGMWGLVSYFDSIYFSWSVAAHRLQPPAHFALLLDIDEDSIMSYGSIFDRKYAVGSEDTLVIYESMGGRWWLRKEEDRLVLTQLEYTYRDDTVRYEYRRMDHLRRLTDTLARVHQLSIGMNKYFNQQLMAGDYAFEDVLITFNPDGTISGDFPYKAYQVRNYFGTSHPFQNYDVVTMYRKDSDEYEYFHWKQNLEVMELTKLVRDSTIIDHGDYIEQNDDFVLTKKTLYLHRNV